MFKSGGLDLPSFLPPWLPHSSLLCSVPYTAFPALVGLCLSADLEEATLASLPMAQWHALAEAAMYCCKAASASATYGTQQ